MRRIRLVALDIDGTVVDERGDIVEANREPIARAQDLGVLIVLATARAPQSAARFAKELELTTPIICCNGALARWPERDEELWHLRIPMEAARKIALFTDHNSYELATTVDDMTYFRQRPGEPLGYRDEGHWILETNAAALTNPPTRILAVGHEPIDEILTAQREPLRSDVAFWPEHRDNAYTSLTMVHAQASKGWAPADIQRRIARAIERRLSVQPERYSKPLSGTLRGYWKLRVGDYRVVFSVVRREVWILAIRHRRAVYEKATGRRPAQS